jgi:catechol 2,3-dioxygenase
LLAVPEVYPSEFTVPSKHHLGHVHLKVRDIERSLAFYTDVLDLDVTERYGRFAFLTFGDHHHDLALQAVGEDAPGPGRGVGLYHAAFECADAADLRAAYERLRERDVAVTPVDHRISKALYFDDPDGNGVELYLDTREETGRDEWRGENIRFDPTEL